MLNRGPVHLCIKVRTDHCVHIHSGKSVVEHVLNETHLCDTHLSSLTALFLWCLQTAEGHMRLCDNVAHTTQVYATSSALKSSDATRYPVFCLIITLLIIYTYICR